MNGLPEPFLPEQQTQNQIWANTWGTRFVILSTCLLIFGIPATLYGAHALQAAGNVSCVLGALSLLSTLTCCAMGNQSGKNATYT